MMMHLWLELAPGSQAMVSFTEHNFLLSTESFEQEITFRLLGCFAENLGLQRVLRKVTR